jgi:N6-adenosine-specific RNA methylase IME4
VAKIAGLSHGNIAKVEFIKDRAAEPVKEQLRRGELAIDRVYQNLKNEERRENIKTAAAVMPDGVFNVIYADPPWKYGHSRSDSRAIEGKYPTEELEDIKNLQIPTADDAVLFLWATAPKLPEAIEVMKAWGFEYKTSAVWDKMINGEGYWFRGRHELLMVGVKGEVSPPEAGKHTGSVYEEECDEENTPDSVYKKKRGEHSVKPEYYYQMIEEMFPYGKYLELFARQRYSDKWAVYGNQVE